MSRFAIQSILAPIPVDRRPRRFAQLFAGLVLYGITMGLLVRAVLGLDPWDVFHQGLAGVVPLSFGTVITAVSVVVLLLWIPLRQRPGFGTVANALVIGWTTDATLALIPQVTALGIRIPLLVAGIVGNAVAGALYIGAGLGPGPRDGLMTGLVAKGVGSVRLVRTCMELTVLGIGWALGGTVGVGTVLFAISIGPLLHILLPRLTVQSADQPDGRELAGSVELRDDQVDAEQDHRTSRHQAQVASDPQPGLGTAAPRCSRLGQTDNRD